MEMSYDPTYNIAYIKLQIGAEEVETIKVSDELIVNMTPDGKVYGNENSSVAVSSRVAHGLRLFFQA
jgi:uncharacterized protein YuzE